MAGSDDDPRHVAESGGASTANETTHMPSFTPQTDAPPSSSVEPVELNNLSPETQPVTSTSQQDQPSHPVSQTQNTPIHSEPPPAPTLAPQPHAFAPPELKRTETEAIGPNVEGLHTAMATHPSPSGSSPVILITLMLMSSARHLFKIDERYLKKRAVNGLYAENGTFDPLRISVYTLKELIWKDWRDEWEPRPVSPALIRLILLGHMLEDNKTLRDSRFTISTTPHVVHMTVRPADILDDEDGGKTHGKGSLRHVDRDGDDRSPGCRCVIL
ncbi:hypothetical protein LTR66_006085 [Elasticomyces elasticus]|nr:hypothetical protein LTR50_006362 [Elasticomyces elasticus]KAK4993195.1 hypothetical protein LTR66_006085 [Elasticomyces elasticus]